MFVPSAPWEQAATSTKVFKVNTQWIEKVSDASLAAMFADLQRRGIALAIAGLMMPRAPTACGAGTEGYSAPGTMGLVARRIKSLGGDLKYVAMDEPLWYGHHVHGPNACRSSIPDLVTAVATNVVALRVVFPDVLIGDVEPLSLATVPDWLSEITTFAATYKTAIGTPLAFVHADVQWGEDYLSELQQFASQIQAAGMKVGIIYNGDPTDATDVAWTTHAEQRFTAIELTLVPDQAILQTWMSHPMQMLPENQPGTMTYLIDRYLAARTKLTIQLAGSNLTGQLTKAEDNSPVAGASVTISALDTSAAGIPTIEFLDWHGAR